jgi:cyclophilin family peptidyl-prolyl cis-trans isomerase/HEAT repeat protein
MHLVLGIVLVALGTLPSAQQTISLRERMLVAEDARAQTDADLAALRQGLTHADPKLRQQAVRAIGRLERADLISSLTRALADANVNVRIEAANAVGQSAKGAKGVADAQTRLIQRAKVEQEPRVWRVVAATLGRLQYATAADIDAVEGVIARVLPSPTSTVIQIDSVLGATEGLEALVRQSGKIAKLKATTLTGLRAASALEGRPQDADKLARIRRLATLALAASGAVARPQLEAGIADADEEVRRLIMVAARGEIEGRDAVIRRALTDVSPRVRYEALQTWGRAFQKVSCEPIFKAVNDANPHVVLLAIDLLGNGCSTPQSPAATLQSLLQAEIGWHRPAHALVALAKVAPEDARKALPQFANSTIWQVRMYAARAAGVLAAVDVLERLARDAHDNVREAALAELITLKRPETTRLALDALTRPDYQLVMTAARALAATTEKDVAVPALQQALRRIHAEQRDTSRDARNAIYAALEKLGAPEPAESPKPLGGSTRAFPMQRIDALATSRLRFTMAGRGTFDLRLMPDEAPVTALHIATLARDGYYNGLTFHRVVPNFVIQGGSPGANEYAGQGPFMRDEVGLVPHRRGTVGISTRGRDTGDAQIFINLVDLPRLDHTYTVFAEVVAGMDVVDAILEGDVIERVEVIAQK